MMPPEVDGCPSAKWIKLNSTNDLQATYGIMAPIQGGKLGTNEGLFVGRIFFRGGIHPCTVGPKDTLAKLIGTNSVTSKTGYVFTSHGGDAVKLYNQSLEVLVSSKKMELRWKRKVQDKVPSAVIVGGMDAIGTFVRGSRDGASGMGFQPTERPQPLWIARAYVKGEIRLGKAGPHIHKGNKALIPFGDDEVTAKDFEILVAAKLDGPDYGQSSEGWKPDYGPDLNTVLDPDW